jgi:uncharacterized membrane protein
MIVAMHIGVLLGMSATALFGIAVATIIRGRKNRPNVCLPGENCEEVLSSRYSNFLGLPLESLGLAYYTALAIATAAMAVAIAIDFVSPAHIDVFAFAILGITGAGFAMSCYLTFVQTAYIRRWCPWCLRSAAAATISFLLAILFYMTAHADMLPILVSFHDQLEIVHLTSFALALVAATVSDVVVIRFMRSFSVSEIAERTFRYATQTTVALLFVVILTFVGLYLPDVVILKQTPAVLAQGVAVLLVSINAAFLNLFVSPYLYDMVAKKTVSISRARTLRRFAFALAAISFVSWYSAFALALYPTLDYAISTLILGYSVATFAAVLIGLIFESISCGRRSSV